MDQLVTSFREKQWLAMLNEQKQSGLTVKDWCSENGISENCFYYRQHRLRERIGSALPTFVVIKPPAEITEERHLENMKKLKGKVVCAGGLLDKEGKIMEVNR